MINLLGHLIFYLPKFVLFCFVAAVVVAIVVLSSSLSSSQLSCCSAGVLLCFVLCSHPFGWLPSGKLLHNYGKSPFFMGKSTINGQFSIAFCMFTTG